MRFLTRPDGRAAGGAASLQEPMSAAPDIFAYDDYRAFLRDFYASKKGQKRGFSLRAFSRKAGLTSSNYLKLVMDGDRNLSASMAERFADACGLREREQAYPRTLRPSSIRSPERSCAPRW